jgi:hypothetical protein
MKKYAELFKKILELIKLNTQYMIEARETSPNIS